MMISAGDRYTLNRRNGLGRGGRTLLRDMGEGDGLKTLSDRIYKTYRSRLRAANRTRLRGQLWNLPLITSPVVATVVAIVAIVFPESYNDRTDVLLVILSILTLVASIIVPSANYSVTAEQMFAAYRRLQRLSAFAERQDELVVSRKRRGQIAHAIDLEYQEILDSTQNHTGADYWGVVGEEARRRRKLPDGTHTTSAPANVPLSGRLQIATSWLLTALPVMLTLALVPLLVPAIGALLGV